MISKHSYTDLRFPRVGMRIIKSSVAMFLCLIIYLLRGQAGLPFYSGYAAIICVRADFDDSLKMSYSRTIGTFIGGLLGVLFLLAGKQFPFIFAWAPLKYALISLVLIPLIYITVIIKLPTASLITCIVFVSIALNNDMGSIFEITSQRMMDTLIGIFVSLGVNLFRLPWRPGRHTLFICSLKNAFLDSSGRLSTATVFKLRHMLNSGGKLTFYSEDNPALLISRLNGLEPRLPVITLHGAALYNVKECRYEECRFLSEDTVVRVRELFGSQGAALFTTTIFREEQYIYHDEVSGELSGLIHGHWQSSPGRYYIQAGPPEGAQVICLSAAGKLEDITRLREAAEKLSEELEIITYIKPFSDIEDVFVLNIFSRSASPSAALELIKARSGAKQTVFIGAEDETLPIAERADIIFAAAGSGERLRNAADYIIKGRDTDAAVRLLGRLYFWRKAKPGTSNKPL